ncbi:MAG: hypothetical protein AAF654_05805 [Myxococcota bacterium]
MALLSRLVFAAVLFGTAPVFAESEVRQAERFGIGLGAGYASGVSMKYFLSDVTSIQGTVGALGTFDENDGDGIAVGADFLLEMPAFFTHTDIELAWHIGAGAGIGIVDEPLDDGLTFSVQGVVGVQVNLVPIPLDVAIEYRPELRIIEDPEFDLVELGAHVRYYF